MRKPLRLLAKLSFRTRFWESVARAAQELNGASTNVLDAQQTVIAMPEEAYPRAIAAIHIREGIRQTLTALRP